MAEPDLLYAEAKRTARQLLGVHADVEKLKNTIVFPARVGVWVGDGQATKKRFVYVGMGTTFREALEDARRHQLLQHTAESTAETETPDPTPQNSK